MNPREISEEYFQIEPQMFCFKNCCFFFFQADLEEGEESFREITLIAESQKLGKKEDIVHLSLLFRFLEVQ